MHISQQCLVQILLILFLFLAIWHRVEEKIFNIGPLLYYPFIQIVAQGSFQDMEKFAEILRKHEKPLWADFKNVYLYAPTPRNNPR